MSSYPYCVHGKYVGGCGADYMCHACEMGYEEPTLAEMTREIEREMERFSSALLKIAAENNHELPVLLKTKFEMVVQKFETSLTNLFDEAAEIERWSEHPNDKNWIHNRHNTYIAEWEEKDTVQQIASLPQSIQDGG